MLYFWDEISALKSYFHSGLKRPCNAHWPKLNVHKIYPPEDAEIYSRVREALERISTSRLDLLTQHFVFHKTPKELAAEMRIYPSTLGGKLSQAKTALRKELSDLIPTKKERTKLSIPPTEAELLNEKREKISRMLIKRQ